MNAAHTAEVVAAFGRHCLVRLPAQTDAKPAIIQGRLLKIICGDRVTIQTQSVPLVITGVLPRTNQIYREDATKRRLIAANVDQVLILLACSTHLTFEWLYRAFAALHAEGIAFQLLLTKADREDFPQAQAQLAVLERLGIHWHALSLTRNVDEARSYLHNLLQKRSSLLIGRSGVGKSTLCELMSHTDPVLKAALQQAKIGQRQTTTATRSYALKLGNGSLLDSPGFDSFGLNHLSLTQIQQAFEDVMQFQQQCRFSNCRHEKELFCAVKQALSEGLLDAKRVACYQRIEREMRTHL